MSDVPHASVPGSAGSAVPAAARAPIQLTPRQYYTRLTGAFAVGAVVGTIVGALAGGKGVTILTEEPPIRVRGGGLDIEIESNGSEYWAEKGGRFQVESVAEAKDEYNFEIILGNNCSTSGTPPTTVKQVTLDYTGVEADKVTIKSQSSWGSKKSRVTPKGKFKKDPNNEKRLSYRRESTGVDGPIKVKAKPADNNKPDWDCEFPANSFQGLCLYTSRKCKYE